MNIFTKTISALALGSSLAMAAPAQAFIFIGGFGGGSTPTPSEYCEIYRDQAIALEGMTKAFEPQTTGTNRWGGIRNMGGKIEASCYVMALTYNGERAQVRYQIENVADRLTVNTTSMVLPGGADL